MKKLLTGNEAIALGAWEYGVKFATAYPGTPSTETLENVAQYKEITSQWSVNEKVAFEVAAGAAMAGARTLVAMKHVGVNVAADPLFTMSYIGANGGLVLMSADDPGMHSSQNEQDNRRYAKFAKIPLLEPADSQEAKDMVGVALDISEEYDTPVMLRTTTRISHSKSLVEYGERQEHELKEYKKDPVKNVMMPAFAKPKHVLVEKRIESLKEYSEKTPLNFEELNDTSYGIITSGISYQYVKESLPNASILKLGFSYPMPEKMIKEFASKVDKLYIVEELDPFIEETVKSWGIDCVGKEIFTLIGEYDPAMIKKAITGEEVDQKESYEAAIRPPVLCPGCPHRGVFYVLKKIRANVAGDIGCYTLGALPPLESMHTTLCMGASIGTALGMEKANPELAKETVAVIGDSTFMHSGLTGIADMLYNKGTGTVMILDNSITAMTGHQHNPTTGYTLGMEPTHVVDIEAVVKALGVKRVYTIDPFELKDLEKLLKEEMATREPSVIIAKRPCALIIKPDPVRTYVDHDVCIGCKACMRVGCPAITFENNKSNINDALCVSCGVCQRVCPVGAIKREE
jgi:indolepyruvate ferredoxin oxidoreductase alpha subunit